MLHLLPDRKCLPHVSNLNNLVELTMIRNASKDTNFLKANDHLSRMASGLIHIMEQTDFAWDEMRAYGAPSECWTLIYKSIIRDKVALFAEFGMTPRQFSEEAAARTSEKWVYIHLDLNYLETREQIQ
jgi:hypothetical protein